jgi:hypothetical protein
MLGGDSGSGEEQLDVRWDDRRDLLHSGVSAEQRECGLQRRRVRAGGIPSDGIGANVESMRVP